VAGTDVEKHQLVGALSVIQRRQFHRISGVTKVDEVDPFHHPTVGYVKTGNDPNGTHDRLPGSFRPQRLDGGGKGELVFVQGPTDDRAVESAGCTSIGSILNRGQRVKMLNRPYAA